MINYRDIFKSAGFVVKQSVLIDDLYPDVIAIGADETLWLGAENAAPRTLINYIKKIQELFDKTLDDLPINIRAFIVNPNNIDSQNINNIALFDSIQDLQSYINNNKNRKIKKSEQEDFIAYSNYIDKVLEYFDRVRKRNAVN